MQGLNSSYFLFSFREAEGKLRTWLWPSPKFDPPVGMLLCISILGTASLVRFICLGSPRAFPSLKVHENLSIVLKSSWGHSLSLPFLLHRGDN